MLNIRNAVSIEPNNTKFAVVSTTTGVPWGPFAATVSTSVNYRVDMIQFTNNSTADQTITVQVSGSVSTAYLAYQVTVSGKGVLVVNGSPFWVGAGDIIKVATPANGVVRGFMSWVRVA